MARRARWKLHVFGHILRRLVSDVRANSHVRIFFTDHSSDWLSWTSLNVTDPIILDIDLQPVGLQLKTSADLARFCDLTRGENGRLRLTAE